MIQLLHMMYRMAFSKRLAELRKGKGLTQEGLADLVGLTKLQIYRYERGASQPTLDVLKKLAKALSVTIDDMAFDEGERGPGTELALQFEAVSQLPPNEQQVIQEVLDSLIIKYQTRRWDSTRQQKAANP